jgi:hypothetical protein
LPTDVVIAVNIEGDLAEGIRVEVLRFYGVHVPGVPWVSDEVPGI